MNYRIFYDDDTSYDGDVSNAPSWGVLVVIQDDKDSGRCILQNADYYVWDNRGDGERWWDVDFIGLIDYLACPGWKKVLIGRLVANEVQQKAFDKAYSDPDFTPKTSWSIHHRKSV